MGQPENIARFCERAQAVLTVVTEVGNLAEAFKYAADLTSKQGGKSIAAPGMGEEELALLVSICKGKDLVVLTENLRQEMGQIATGFTRAQWGIAETATLVMDSKSEEIRIASMLSETHVAVIAKSRIVPDVESIEEELSRMMNSAPGYVAFISGASRTADIERVLTIGVHGPQELHVLILEEDSDDKNAPRPQSL
jgi:L-lactate dehydrogenase complex protein LldG